MLLASLADALLAWLMFLQLLLLLPAELLSLTLGLQLLPVYMLVLLLGLLLLLLLLLSLLLLMLLAAFLLATQASLLHFIPFLPPSIGRAPNALHACAWKIAIG
jgi:hypothetical protein